MQQGPSPRTFVLEIDKANSTLALAVANPRDLQPPVPHLWIDQERAAFLSNGGCLPRHGFSYLLSLRTPQRVINIRLKYIPRGVGGYELRVGHVKSLPLFFLRAISSTLPHRTYNAKEYAAAQHLAQPGEIRSDQPAALSLEVFDKGWPGTDTIWRPPRCCWCPWTGIDQETGLGAGFRGTFERSTRPLSSSQPTAPTLPRGELVSLAVVHASDATALGGSLYYANQKNNAVLVGRGRVCGEGAAGVSSHISRVASPSSLLRFQVWPKEGRVSLGIVRSCSESLPHRSYLRPHHIAIAIAIAIA